MMENSQLETLKPSQSPRFTFPPHRRRSLQSNTYRIFAQIMSHCNSLQPVRQHQKQGEAAEENVLVPVDSLGEAAERNELLDHDPMESESLLLVQQNLSANVTKEASGFQVEHGDEWNSTGERTLPEGIEHDLQLKEKELEKLLYASSAMNSPICDDIEEGEISGNVEVHDKAMGFLLDTALSPEEKKDEEAQIPRDIVDNQEAACDGRASDLRTYSGFGSTCLNVADSGKDIMLKRQGTARDPDTFDETLAGRIKKVDDHRLILETRQMMDQASKIRGTDHQAASVNDLASCPQVNSEGKTENKEVATSEKDNRIEKKKRKPLSKEQKAKKKKKERIKRAEKNRKLGVKRLKLQPVLKPKKVTYCRHYLKGRCQEGDKCKFSHDTVPLTKSQPCRHFARHSCMKGDDCPFDHQLSKYPCNNFVATGHCSRGADCLFSHKMSGEGGQLLTSNVLKPESKSLFQTSDPNSKKQVKFHNNPPQNSSDKSTEKIVAQILQRPATRVPTGISVFSPLRSSAGDASKHEQSAQHQKGDNGVKIGPKITTSSSDSGQKSNDLTKRKPMMTPKGINFLSFGKAPVLDSGNKTNHSAGESFLGELNQITSSSSLPKSGCAKTENPGGRNLSGPELKNTKAENSISSASRPQGVKFLSFAEVPGDSSSATRSAGLPPFDKNVGLSLVRERENPLGRLEFSSGASCGSSSSSNPFCLSPHQSGQKNAVGMSSSHRISLPSNTPSSVQKALQSTLAFAAEFDSKIKFDERNGTPVISAGNHPAK